MRDYSLKKIENKPNGYVLFHAGVGTMQALSFDVIIRKDKFEMLSKLINQREPAVCYEISCPFAEKFLQDHSDYKYFCSGDLAYSPYIQFKLIKCLAELIELGFVFVFIQS